MSWLTLLIVAIFLPLFPFSMLFNGLFGRLRSTTLRILLLLAWPSAGLALLHGLAVTPPAWLHHWAVLTALLYAFRALALRDLSLWLGHVATSAWALLWLPALSAAPGDSLALQVAAFSLPLALLAWLTGRLEKTYGAAFAGPLAGLASGSPRLSGVLVLTVLAVIGTPMFPAFFALLGMVNELLQRMPMSAVGVVLVWMLWAWAGMRILQGLIVGPATDERRADLDPAHSGVLGITLLTFAIGGLWLSGSLV